MSNMPYAGQQEHQQQQKQPKEWMALDNVNICVYTLRGIDRETITTLTEWTSGHIFTWTFYHHSLFINTAV